jgi:hypothetical protein
VITRQHTVWCDALGCSPAFVLVDAATHAAARAEARRQGWECSRGVDRCPRHRSQSPVDQWGNPLEAPPAVDGGPTR